MSHKIEVRILTVCGIIISHVYTPSPTPPFPPAVGSSVSGILQWTPVQACEQCLDNFHHFHPCQALCLRTWDRGTGGQASAPCRLLSGVHFGSSGGEERCRCMTECLCMTWGMHMCARVCCVCVCVCVITEMVVR